MDTEAIRVSTSPPVRTSPSTEPSGRPAVSVANSEKVNVATVEDTVSLSAEGTSEQKGEAQVSTGKVSAGGAPSQTKLEVTDGNEIILKVVDSKTGQVIKEIPAREQQRLSHAIKDSVDKLTNNSHE